MGFLEDFQKIAEKGKNEEVVELDNMKITLKTLTAGEEIEVFSACEGKSNILYISENKIETLARSIVAINGNRYEVDKASDDKKYEEFIKAKLDKVRSFDQTVIDYLYSEFSKMISKNEKIYKISEA